MKLLDFFVKCFFVFVRNKGEVGLIAAFIPVSAFSSIPLSVALNLILGYLLKGQFNALICFLFWGVSFFAIYFWIIKKLKDVYILNKRPIKLPKFIYHYYLISIIIFFLSSLTLFGELIVLGKFSTTKISQKK